MLTRKLPLLLPAFQENKIPEIRKLNTPIKIR